MNITIELQIKAKNKHYNYNFNYNIVSTFIDIYNENLIGTILLFNAI